MPDFDELDERIDNDADDTQLRRDVADAVIAVIHHVERDGGYWEKAHLAEANRALSARADENSAPTQPWLKLCLVSLRAALTPPASRSGNFTTHAAELEELSFAALKAQARLLRSLT